MRCARPFFEALDGGIEKRSRQFARFFMGYGSIYTEHQFGKLLKKKLQFSLGRYTLHMSRNDYFTFEKNRRKNQMYFQIRIRIGDTFWHEKQIVSTPDSEVPKSKKNPDFTNFGTQLKNEQNQRTFCLKSDQNRFLVSQNQELIQFWFF